LRKKNKDLQQKVDEMTLMLQTYERQLPAGGPGGGKAAGIGGGAGAPMGQPYAIAPAGLNKEQEKELVTLRQKVEELLKVNDTLHDRFTRVESRIGNIVQSAEGGVTVVGGGSSDHDDRVAAVLVNTNEMLMKELNDLKAMMAAGEHHRELLAGGGAVNVRTSTKLPPAGGRVPFKVSMDSPRVGVGASQDTVFTPAGGNRTTTSYTPLQMTAGGYTLGGGIAGGVAMYPQTPHGKTLLTKNLAQVRRIHPAWGHSRCVVLTRRLLLPPCSPRGADEFAPRGVGGRGEGPQRSVGGVPGATLRARAGTCVCCVGGTRTISCLDSPTPFLPGVCVCVVGVQELEEQRGVVGALEENLVFIKQQMAVVYQDFAARAAEWEGKEKRLEEEKAALRREKDEAAFRLNQTQRLFDAMENDGEMQAEFTRLGRRVVGYEVRELMSDREKQSVTEQLLQEQIARRNLEMDFVEMETALKKRILYLEQYKAAVSSKMGRLQGRLDVSVPNEDYEALQKELECLRDDHLITLRREVEARIAALRALDQAHELRALHMTNVELETRVVRAEHATQLLDKDLINQKEATKRALAAAHTSTELAETISEMARCRGEATRYQVEAEASKRRGDLLEARYKSVEKESIALAARVKELEQRQDDASAAESEATRRVAEVELRYTGGLTGDEAREVKSQLDKARRELEEAQRDAARFKVKNVTNARQPPSSIAHV
jgi:hypothetical protein